MALKANYEFLFFGKEDGSFLENYAYDLFQDYGEKSGQIFVTLEVGNNPAYAEEIGGAIFETMQNTFFEEIEADPYERFEMSLKAVNKALDKFRSEKKSEYIGNLSVIIAAIVGDMLYLTQCGEAEAYLVRKRYVSVLSEGLSEEGNDEIFSNIASGQIEEGDSVLFSSTRLLRYISKTDLGKFLGKKNVVKALDEVKDAISTEMLGRVGLAGIVFEEASELDVEEVEDSVDKVTKSVMEASDEQLSSKRESITGRFMTALKKRRQGKTDIFQGSSGGGGLEKIKNLFGGTFSKGFGKDKILIALILVIFVLTVGILVVKDNTAEQAELERLDEVLIGVQDKIAEASTKSAYDKETAKTILDKAYADALEVLNSGYYRSKAQTFLLEIEDTRDQLDSVERVESPVVFADLSQKRADVNALGFVELGDRVFVYEYNALYEVVLDQVQDPLTIDEEEQVIDATGFDDRNSIVFLTESGKLIEYKDGTVSFMDTDDGAFRKGVAIDDWSNNIYLLDSTEGQIWKYPYKGTSDKFGAAEAYVGGETDLSATVDLAIDASVYILKGNGDLMRLYGGNDAGLVVQNQPFASITDPAEIFTNERLDEVYVVDSRGGRIFVYNKDDKSGNLVYKSQYLFEEIGEIRDVYVNADAKKMYVLTQNKVVEIAL